jgi:hypothetical protein
MRPLKMQLILIFMVLSNVLIAQKYGLGDIDKQLFEKYRVPELNIKSSTLRLGYNFNAYSHQYKDNENYDRISESMNLNLLSDILYNYESELKSFGINGFLRLHGRNSFSKNDDGRWFGKQKEFEKAYSYKLNLNTFSKSYFNQSGFNYGHKFHADINVSKSENEIKREIDPGKYTNSSKRQNISASLGIGFGKIRNVTPLVEAIRYQNRLLDLNLIDNKLPSQTLLALSQELSKRQSYNLVFDRPDKYFWGNVENLLNDNNVSLSRLNQYASSYLREIENELKFMRYEGTELNFYLGGNYIKDEWDPNGDNKYVEEILLLTSNLQFRNSFQLSLYSQLSNTVNLEAGTNIIANPQVKQQYSLSHQISYSNELTDRFLFEVSNYSLLVYKNRKEQERVFDNITRISGSYFIEDQVRLTLDYFWNYESYEDSPINSEVFRSQQDLRLSIIYSLFSNIY